MINNNELIEADNDDSLKNRKTIFKSNFKYIEFKKKSSSEEARPNPRQEQHDSSIQTFYNDLVKGDDSAKHLKKSNHVAASTSTTSPLKKKLPLKKSKNEFLKAAEQNDINLIKSYLEDDFDLCECDDFKWNSLMISVCSFNNDIVKYLLEAHSNHARFRELLFAKDLSGCDAESLAAKRNNLNALEMIRQAKLKLESGNDKEDKEEEEATLKQAEAEANETLFCESCKRSFLLSDESHIQHVTSIVHQLNENEADCDMRNKRKVNYHLRASSNKGYQMLLKSGWSEGSGLGLNEQGRTQPIRTRQKLDRLGIGVMVEAKNTPILKKTHKLFKLKGPEEKHVKSVQSEFKSLQNLKAIKKKHEKMKKVERSLRNYFNT